MLALKKPTIGHQKIKDSFLHIFLLILVAMIWGRAQANGLAVTLKSGKICMQNLIVIMLKLKIKTVNHYSTELGKVN